MTIYASSLFEGLGKKTTVKKEPSPKNETTSDAKKQAAAFKRAAALEKKKKILEESEALDEIIESKETELEAAKEDLAKKEAQKLKRKLAAAERRKQKEIEAAVEAELEKTPSPSKVRKERAPKKQKVTDENEVPKWLPSFLEKYAIAKGGKNGEKPNVKEIREASHVVAAEKWEDPALRKKINSEYENSQNRLYSKMFPQ